MNSWKETKNTHEIYLNLRSNFYYLYSKTSHYAIQNELRKNIGKFITLHVIKSDNFLRKTPIECLSILYEAHLSKQVKNFLKDPIFIMMQSIFDIEWNKLNIKII